MSASHNRFGAVRGEVASHEIIVRRRAGLGALARLASCRTPTTSRSPSSVATPCAHTPRSRPSWTSSARNRYPNSGSSRCASNRAFARCASFQLAVSDRSTRATGNRADERVFRTRHVTVTGIPSLLNTWTSGYIISRQVRLRQIRRSPTQHLVLLLEQPQSLAQFTVLRVLGGDAGSEACCPRLSAGRQPVMKRYDAEIPKSAATSLQTHTGPASTSHLHHVLTKPSWIRAGHGEHPSSSPSRHRRSRCHHFVQQSPACIRRTPAADAPPPQAA